MCGGVCVCGGVAEESLGVWCGGLGVWESGSMVWGSGSTGQQWGRIVVLGWAASVVGEQIILMR